MKHKIIFETISGSHAYGTNVEGSDVDKRGVYIQDLDEILRGDYCPQFSDENNDETYYEIGRFLELLMEGNPNVIEILNTDKRFHTICTKEWDALYELRQEFITQKLITTFGGYAQTQIKKSKGLGKKLFNPQPKERKDLLEFCYVIKDGKSIPFWEWFEDEYWDLFDEYSKENAFKIMISKWGLSKLSNGNQLYVFYEDSGDNNFRGIVKNLETTDLRLSSIPKEVETNSNKELLWFNLDGFVLHCKQHKQYWEWVEKRNELRYEDNIQGETGYDKKHILHVLRLLYTLRDICLKGEVIVFRPEAEFLISIRKGQISFSELMEKADSILDECKPEMIERVEVDREKIKDFILKIRKNAKV